MFSSKKSISCQIKRCPRCEAKCEILSFSPLPTFSGRYNKDDLQRAPYPKGEGTQGIYTLPPYLSPFSLPSHPRVKKYRASPTSSPRPIQKPYLAAILLPSHPKPPPHRLPLSHLNKIAVSIPTWEASVRLSLSLLPQ